MTDMNYNKAIDYIETAGLLGSKPGLSRITELCRRLGNPQEKIKYVHIAGTNGKGSVCAMLNEILISSGYKTGLFTSPHLISFRERIKINGAPIPKERLAEITEKIKQCANDMPDKPTEFEIATAAAFMYFYEEKCDIAVLETGLGGRLDATNIIKSPLLSVITGISLDHTAILGDSIEKIAAEKGGIIKENCPLVLAACKPEANSVIENIAKERRSPLFKVDYSRQGNISVSLGGTAFDFAPYGKINLSIIGVCQAKNAATAITAAEVLNSIGIKTGEKPLLKGLKNTRWQARFEILNQNPLIIYDGAHNSEGAAALKENLLAAGINKAVFLTGVMADKDYTGMVNILSPLAQCVFTVTPHNPRALDAQTLKDTFCALGVPAMAFDTVDNGVLPAINAAKKENLPLVICGSLYMYGELKTRLADFLKGRWTK